MPFLKDYICKKIEHCVHIGVSVGIKWLKHFGHEMHLFQKEANLETSSETTKLQTDLPNIEWIL